MDHSAQRLVYRVAFICGTVLVGASFLAGFSDTLARASPPGTVSDPHRAEHRPLRERLGRPANSAPWRRHAGGFCLACLLLGYLLFQVWPYAYVAVGFSQAESMLIVVAVINVHHFVADAFSWRLRRDPNYAVVGAAPAAAA
jgi:hypothetical protein